MQNDFGVGSVSKRIIAQSIPLMIAQLVQLLYNIVDRIYIGHLPGIGSMALTGVGLTFPIITLVGAFTNLFGMGGTPLFSIARGAREEERAETILSNVFALLLGCSLVLILICYLFKKPILFLFGASEESYYYANLYLMIYILGTPFTMTATGMNGFINAQGFPQIGMLTTVLGAVLNLILDPIFIFVLKMGVQGAALATIISQLISALWVVSFLSGDKPAYRLKRSRMRPQWALTKQIVTLGFSGFILQATNSLCQILCNAMLQNFGGDLYVGVMTVLNSVRELFNLPVSGITDGFQSVLGFNYGAKKYGRVKEGIRFTILIGLIYTFTAWMLIMIIPRFLMSLFTNDAEMIELGVHCMFLFFFGYIFMALQYVAQGVFRGLGMAKPSIFFSIFRKVIIVSPLTVILPYLGLGTDGVFLAEPISNFVGGIASFTTMWFIVYRKMDKLDQAQK